MHKYRSLVAWQRAHEAMLLALRTSDAAFHPRSKALFDQLRRAVISIEANIVEGYALSTPLQFRRHLRIALGSAAEGSVSWRSSVKWSTCPSRHSTSSWNSTTRSSEICSGWCGRASTLRSERHLRVPL